MIARAVLFLLFLHTTSSYEIVMPTKNREKTNYLLRSLESFKDELMGTGLFLYRHGKNFDDFETACLKYGIECNVFDIDLDIADNYLKWRTEQNMLVKSILEDFLSRDEDHVVWVEDDVILINSLEFVNDTKEDVICLRSGYKYCGATGYVFSRGFVLDLIKAIDMDKNNMPIDWILDKTVHNKNYFRKRKSIIKHIGVYSSRKDVIKREIDI